MRKNIRKIPDNVAAKLKEIRGNEVIVGCALRLTREMLIGGKLAHLGVSLSAEGLIIPTAVVPLETQGKYSDINVNGLEIVRKDLPKETHYNSIESPNWGDSYNGTHTVNLPYKKFPREFQPPRELEISMQCNDTGPNLPSYIIAFQVKEVLDKTSKNFDGHLFENLNLLQENVGACGLESAEMPLEEYVKSLHVAWELLPPGTLDQALQRLFQGRTPSIEEKNVATERYDFFLSLKPKSLVFGQSGLRRYFGALLENDLVVFENIKYGNAIYVLFESWADLSKLSRIDLLSGKFGSDFERVIHISDWKGTVKEIIEKRRKRIKPKA